MAKPVVITADSTCDLSQELIERYAVDGITPLSILLGDRVYTDGVDITPDDIYKCYELEGILPKTAAVTPNSYKQFFSGFTKRGFDVVHLNLSSKISSTYQNARIAAADMPGVYPVDSLSLCVGIGLLVIKACEMRDAGKAAKQIADEMERMKNKVKTSFMVANLEFLSKGGRCSSVTALGANILGIKPVIEMKDGELSVGKKYRGKLQQCYEQYAAEKLKSRDDLDLSRVIIAHSGVSQETIDGVANIVKGCSAFEDILVSRAGCTITSHCGRDTLAVIFMEK